MLCFICMNVCLHVFMCTMCVVVSLEARKKALESLNSGCEPPEGAGNRAQILCENSQVLLVIEHPSVP